MKLKEFVEKLNGRPFKRYKFLDSEILKYLEPRIKIEYW